MSRLPYGRASGADHSFTFGQELFLIYDVVRPLLKQRGGAQLLPPQCYIARPAAERIFSVVMSIQ